MGAENARLGGRKTGGRKIVGKNIGNDRTRDWDILNQADNVYSFKVRKFNVSLILYICKYIYIYVFIYILNICVWPCLS